MKLYTEEQVKQIVEKSRETGLTADYLTLTTPAIELPSDEEVEEGLFHQSNEYAYGYKDAFKWMRDKILQRNL